MADRRHGMLDWGAVGALAGVVGVIVALLAWLHPTSNEPTSPKVMPASSAPSGSGTQIRSPSPTLDPSVSRTKSFTTARRYLGAEYTAPDIMSIAPFEGQGEGSETQVLGSATYSRSVVFSSSCDMGLGKTKYDLAGNYSTFHTVVGVANESTSDKGYRFEVWVGDNRVWSSNMMKLERRTLNLDVRKALTITLSACALGEPEATTGGVFGDPYVEGASER